MPIFSNLRVLKNKKHRVWYITATWYDYAVPVHQNAVAMMDHAVPEWWGWKTQAEALAIMHGYTRGRLPMHMWPRHPADWHYARCLPA